MGVLGDPARGAFGDATFIIGVGDRVVVEVFLDPGVVFDDVDVAGAIRCDPAYVDQTEVARFRDQFGDLIPFVVEAEGDPEPLVSHRRVDVEGALGRGGGVVDGDLGVGLVRAKFEAADLVGAGRREDVRFERFRPSAFPEETGNAAVAVFEDVEVAGGLVDGERFGGRQRSAADVGIEAVNERRVRGPGGADQPAQDEEAERREDG
jgi:hypothetical protein